MGIFSFQRYSNHKHCLLILFFVFEFSFRHRFWNRYVFWICVNFKFMFFICLPQKKCGVSQQHFIWTLHIVHNKFKLLCIVVFLFVNFLLVKNVIADHHCLFKDLFNFMLKCLKTIPSIRPSIHRWAKVYLNIYSFAQWLHFVSCIRMKFLGFTGNSNEVILRIHPHNFMHKTNIFYNVNVIRNHRRDCS